MSEQRVPFTVENTKKCICGSCPVQSDSQCSKNKKLGIPDALKQTPLQADAIPGMYCATGKAECTDLDMYKMCMCGACPLWEEYSLAATKPMGYYCRDGKAA